MSEHGDITSGQELESWKILNELYSDSDFKIFWNTLRILIDHIDNVAPIHPLKDISPIDQIEIGQQIFKVLENFSRENDFIKVSFLGNTLEIVFKIKSPEGQFKQIKYFLPIADIPNRNFANKLKQTTDPWQMLKMVGRYFIDNDSYQKKLKFVKAVGMVTASTAIRSSGVSALLSAFPAPESFSQELKPMTASEKIEVRRPMGAPEWFFRDMNQEENRLSREKVSEIGDSLISLSEKYPWLRFINTAREKTKAVEICGSNLEKMVSIYTTNFPNQSPPIIRSSFRNMEEQEIIWGQASEEMKKEGWVAKPGLSEHHLGTAIDFSINRSGGNDFIRDGDHFHTWLKDNAYMFGFVQSYTLPNRKYAVEPWHWRYVGPELAEVWKEMQPSTDMEYILANIEEKSSNPRKENEGPIIALLSKLLNW